MATKSSLSLCLFYFVIVFSTDSMLKSCRSSATLDVQTSPEPPSDIALNSTEFIRSRCGATLYPSLCFTSLAGYSSAIQQSPVHLASVATNLTRGRLAALSARVAALRRTCPSGSAGREAAALRDCSEAVGDAKDQAARTAAELQGLDTAVGPEVAWRVSNAQTWLSAALTNEETCSDVFVAVPDAVGRTKAEVCLRVRRVKQYTSNALALVNSLVAS